MKKLKRGLSLLLVLAMVLSLVPAVFAVNNTSYPDEDELHPWGVEAVTVLSDLKVIEGMGPVQGNILKPGGNFTRAEAATILARLVLARDAADNLKASGVHFSDVAQNYWGAAAIGYASTNEIVVGDGDGKFYPERALKSAEWLKMLLVALGFDPVTEKLVDNPNWADNAVALAQKVKLITSNEAKLPFCRETAILYAWNALKYAYQDVYVVSYKEGNMDKKIVFTNGYDAEKFADIVGGDVVAVTSLAEELYGLTLEEDVTRDIYGRPATVYTWNRVNHTYVRNYPVAETTDKIGTAKDLGKLVKNEDADFETVWVDGQVAANVAAAEAKGTKFEVYDMGRDEYRVVAIRTYVDDIKKTDLDRKGVATLAVDEEYVALDDTRLNTVLPTQKDRKENDVVSYNVGTDPFTDDFVVDGLKVLAGEKHTVTGVEAANADYLYLDGKTDKVFTNGYSLTTRGVLDPALLVVERDVEDCYEQEVTIPNDLVLYYDDLGNVIYAVEVPARQPDGIVYVTRAAVAFKGATGSDLFGNYNRQTFAAKAEIVDASGKKSVVDLAFTEDKKPNDGHYYIVDEYGQPFVDGGKIVPGNAAVDLGLDKPVDQICEYYENEDGTYVLAPVDYVDFVKNSADPMIVSLGDPATSAYLNKDTVIDVLTVDKDGIEAKTYGCDDMPKVEAGQNAIAYVEYQKDPMTEAETDYIKYALVVCDPANAVPQKITAVFDPAAMKVTDLAGPESEYTLFTKDGMASFKGADGLMDDVDELVVFTATVDARGNISDLEEVAAEKIVEGTVAKDSKTGWYVVDGTSYKISNDVVYAVGGELGPEGLNGCTVTLVLDRDNKVELCVATAPVPPTPGP